MISNKYCREHGRQKGGREAKNPSILNISAKKGCFRGFEW